MVLVLWDLVCFWGFWGVFGYFQVVFGVYVVALGCLWGVAALGCCGRYCFGFRVFGFVSWCFGYVPGFLVCVILGLVLTTDVGFA